MREMGKRARRIPLSLPGRVRVGNIAGIVARISVCGEIVGSHTDADETNQPGDGVGMPWPGYKGRRFSHPIRGWEQGVGESGFLRQRRCPSVERTWSKGWTFPVASKATQRHGRGQHRLLTASRAPVSSTRSQQRVCGTVTHARSSCPLWEPSALGASQQATSRSPHVFTHMSDR
jgi:hypothetical protein